MRSAVPVLLLLACAASWAQSPAPQSAAEGRRNQKIQRIVHEDSGNRIEELRYAGQTQSITVQPRGDAPAYEVAPSTPTRGRVADERGGAAAGAGQRFWNVLNF
jgi:hypothetical protein